MTIQTYNEAQIDVWTLGTLQCAQLLLANSVHLALISQYWVREFGKTKNENE